MDNNNLFDKDNQNQNNEQGQFQQQPYQPQQTYQQQPYQPQQPYQQYQPQQSYQPYPQQPYQQQQPYQMGEGELEEPVSFADWMISMLIMMIPCVNIVMIFVWAFGSGTKKSKSNYFKAALVWGLISVVLTFVLMIAFGAIFASMDTGSYNYYGY